LTTPTVNCRCYRALEPIEETFKILQEPVLDQSWYQSLGGGFGPVSEQFVKSAQVKLRELSLSYKLNLTKKFRFRKCYIHWNRKKLMVVD
jgi:hypothetical protein